MITVEFRQPGPEGYRVAATLRVDDAGEYSIDGTLDVDLEEISILDRTRPGGRLLLKDDPAAWARSAHRAFRTAYLVPVVVDDDAAAAEPA